MSHKHSEWTALYWHLGKYGRQDVHLHSCLSSQSCATVLVGEGRECHRGSVHVERRLSTQKGWSERQHEGEALESVEDGAARND
jgi:hypothetical protein